MGKHSGSGRLHHHADGHFLGGIAFFFQFLADLCTQSLGCLQFPNRGNHGEHHVQIAIGRCTVDSPQLGTEDLFSGQADTQASQTQSRIFLFLKAHIADLLVSTDIQCADNHRSVTHDFGYLLIGIKQFFLGGKGVSAQVQELTAHEAYAFCVCLDGINGILGAADIGGKQNLLAGAGNALLAAIGFQSIPCFCSFRLLCPQDSQGFLIGVGIPGAGKAVNRQDLAVFCCFKGNI